jgi:hypothetical protein
VGIDEGYGLAVLLYDSGLSGNCYKVRLLFAQLGLPYERREVDGVGVDRVAHERRQDRCSLGTSSPISS